jgi:hypothetical protein
MCLTAENRVIKYNELKNVVTGASGGILGKEMAFPLCPKTKAGRYCCVNMHAKWRKDNAHYYRAITCIAATKKNVRRLLSTIRVVIMYWRMR